MTEWLHMQQRQRHQPVPRQRQLPVPRQPQRPVQQQQQRHHRFKWDCTKQEQLMSQMDHKL